MSVRYKAVESHFPSKTRGGGGHFALPPHLGVQRELQSDLAVRYRCRWADGDTTKLNENRNRGRQGLPPRLHICEVSGCSISTLNFPTGQSESSMFKKV